MRTVRGCRTGGPEAGMNAKRFAKPTEKVVSREKPFTIDTGNATTEHTSLALRTDALRVVSTRPTALEEGGNEKGGEESSEDGSLSKARGQIKHSQH
jgi:hypothetical protein